MTTPAQIQNMQQAVYKRATAVQMRRLIFTIQLHHVEEEKTLASLKEDQSSAYGQKDLSGLGMQTETDDDYPLCPGVTRGHTVQKKDGK